MANQVAIIFGELSRQYRVIDVGS